MAEKDKKYYWLKLKRDFFKRHDIQIIEAMPNGKDYILFYLKLLCESVDHEGNLRFSEQIPYNEQMLSTITNTNVDVVRSAIKIFSELGMMDVLDDGTYFMNEVEKMIGSETYWAERKRIQKERKMLDSVGQDWKKSNDSGQFPTSPSKSIELEKDIDIEIEKKKSIKEKKPYGEFKNVLLTDEEFEKLKQRFTDYETRIQRLSQYIASSGKRYKSHYATILTWANGEKKKEAPTKTSAYDDLS